MNRLPRFLLSALASWGLLAMGCGQAPEGMPGSEILDGHPLSTHLPPDTIRAIDDPTFLPASDELPLAPDEPVLGIARRGAARAYPLRFLQRREVVNDRLEGLPIAVTW